MFSLNKLHDGQPATSTTAESPQLLLEKQAARQMSEQSTTEQLTFAREEPRGLSLSGSQSTCRSFDECLKVRLCAGVMAKAEAAPKEC